MGRGRLEVPRQAVLLGGSSSAPPLDLRRGGAGHAPHLFRGLVPLPWRRAYTSRAGARGPGPWLETPLERGPEAWPRSGPGASRARWALGGGRSVGLFLQAGECGAEGGGSPGRRRPEVGQVRSARSRAGMAGSGPASLQRLSDPDS